jgi:hypothetical protein
MILFLFLFFFFFTSASVFIAHALVSTVESKGYFFFLVNSFFFTSTIFYEFENGHC